VVANSPDKAEAGRQILFFILRKRCEVPCKQDGQARCYAHSSGQQKKISSRLRLERRKRSTGFDQTLPLNYTSKC
jgi:hypothetical protein